MDVLWRADGPLTAGEVRDALQARRSLAYTTVMTVTVRLWKKGRLTRTRDGRSYRYAPIETREEFEARRMTEILRSVENADLTLARFVNRLSDTELERLRRHV